MLETVDEKLHKTLEKYLGKSFKIVSKQLLVVQKVLTNVKTRGVLEKTLKKINEANHEIENLVGTRTRKMQSKLKTLNNLKLIIKTKTTLF